MPRQGYLTENKFHKKGLAGRKRKKSSRDKALPAFLKKKKKKVETNSETASRSVQDIFQAVSRAVYNTLTNTSSKKRPSSTKLPNERE